MTAVTRKDPLSEAISKRRNRVLDRRDAINLVLRIGLIAAAGWILFTKVFLITQVTGNEMFPAVKDGDLLFIFRLEKDLRKDDIIVYEKNGELRAGRIAAAGTDVVNMNTSGTLQINGTVQSGEIMYPTYAKEGYEYPLQVPEDAVFVLADYRTRGTDSRDFGPVMRDEIKGKVITLLRRRGM